MNKAERQQQAADEAARDVLRLAERFAGVVRRHSGGEPDAVLLSAADDYARATGKMPDAVRRAWKTFCQTQTVEAARAVAERLTDTHLPTAETPDDFTARKAPFSRRRNSRRGAPDPVGTLDTHQGNGGETAGESPADPSL